MITKVVIIGGLLLSAAGTSGQSLPRWPANTRVQVVTEEFSVKEQERIEVAAAAWRPLLPRGLSIDLAERGNVRIVREHVAGLAETTLVPYINGLTHHAIIRVDPRAGSGDKFQGVIEHELGHVLGLHHYADSIMQRSESKRHPAAVDGERLRALYAEARTLPVDELATAEAMIVSEIDLLNVDTPTPVQQYSFTQVVTLGTLRRESTFVWNDAGKLIEINVRGSNDRRLRQIPVLPVGRHPNVNWYQSQAARAGYAVGWKSGKELTVDGVGAADLLFPVTASDGNVRIERRDYKLHRVAVTVKEAEP